mgnify:CR=1 FL=1
MSAPTLDAFLLSSQRNGCDADVIATISAMSTAAIALNNSLRFGSPSGERGSVNADGDVQKELDLFADGIFQNALKSAPVRFLASEELSEPLVINPGARIAVAIDPLDGSSNIDTNVSIGTIFSVLPAHDTQANDPHAPFLQPGNRQLAAGFMVYGPQLALVLTLGSGTHVFVFSPRMGAFVQTRESVVIPEQTQEFAINSSNYRHWEEPVRLYVDDCLKGDSGPRGKNFNTRWIASMVAEAFRILIRGGVYLYPRDDRPSYSNGRLRLVYEANPIAMIVEQAGGRATDTASRILDIQPIGLHQRIPLVFGSAREVEHVGRYHTDSSAIADRSPLFSNRGLFRA